MKSPFGGLLAAFALASFITAHAASSDDVLAAEQARRTALLAGDAEALERLLSDDLRYIHSNGRLETKAEIIRGFRTKHVVYERFELSKLHARLIDPDVATVTGTIEQKKLTGGKGNDLKLLFQSVWRRESGAWRLIAIQTAQPPAPPP